MPRDDDDSSPSRDRRSRDRRRRSRDRPRPSRADRSSSSEGGSSSSESSGARRRRRAEKKARKEARRQKREGRRGEKKRTRDGDQGAPDGDKKKNSSSGATSLIVNQSVPEERQRDEMGNEIEVEQPNFDASGLLAQEDAFERQEKINDPNAPGVQKKANFRNNLESGKAVGTKATLPLDAAVPDAKWRIFIFMKGQEDPVKTAYLGRL